MNRFFPLSRVRGHIFLIPVLVLLCVRTVSAAETSAAQEPSPIASALAQAAENAGSLLPAAQEWISGGNLPLLFALLAIVPGVLIATTCYIRIVTVLSLLRHATGLVQIPSTQIVVILSFFLTLVMMSPTWTRVWREACIPYAQQQISVEEALRRGEAPIRTFLWKQIERTHNTAEIGVFLRYIPDAEMPQYYEDIPWRVLIPAFMMSELKTAFFIGFQLFLPFLIIDLVVSGIMVSMGMMMLPPTAVSLPFKLMLFVLLDAWDPVVQMLLDSFALM